MQTTKKPLPVLLNEIREARRLKNTQREDVSFNLRASFEIARNQAVESWSGLVEELSSQIFPSRAYAIFSEVPQPAWDGPTYDVSTPWREIAANMIPSFGPERLFTTTQHSLMIQGYSGQLHLLGDVGRQVALADVPGWFEPGHLRTDEEVVNFVRRQFLNSPVNSTLSIRAAKGALVNLISNMETVGRKVSFLIVGATKEESDNLRSFFTKSTEITEEITQEELNTINQKLTSDVETKPTKTKAKAEI